MNVFVQSLIYLPLRRIDKVHEVIINYLFIYY